MGWTIAVDRGGTFTDVVARDPSGRLHVRKLLTRSAEYADATVEAVRRLVGSDPVDELRVGTTVATNALLERQGSRVALLVTRGFGDLLEIGEQDRPDLFALHVVKRPPLHAQVHEIDERVRADGSVERPASAADIEAALQAARASGCDALAVLFLHSPLHPAHEELAGRLAEPLGFRAIALSHRVAPDAPAVARGDTTVLEAYLRAGLADYLAGLQPLARRVRLMQSSGGLAPARDALAKDAILSGPAGGTVALARIAELSGHPRLVGVDMGGTSTDVCRCEGGVDRVHATLVAGVRVRAPMVDLVTIAAGGGSRIAVRDGRLQVGPASAGADPGPAAYGRGGPATLTDAQVVLGRVRPEHFPHLALDIAAARAALEEVAREAGLAGADAAARAALDVAVEGMAAAVQRIGTARGVDVRDHALAAFGGAAGQCACALAEALGIETVLIHPLAGVLSAWGLLLADVTRHAVAPVIHGEPRFPETDALAALAAEGFADATALRSVDARYAGTDELLEVPWSPRWREDFEQRFAATFGFTHAGREVELVAARVEAVGRSPRADEPAAPERERLVRGEVVRRAELGPGARLSGPALVVEELASTWVAPGWSARVDGRGILVLQRGSLRPSARRITATRDSVGLELMGNLFMSIAERMGEQLRRVAVSTNIKERLDFSCALFDARGQLVANAPHVPVHLGAMGETVKSLLAERALVPGEQWLCNDPARGGSHLPDLTVMAPVFRDGRLTFVVANRGHHADVGGKSPGSMPAHSTRLDEEGAVFSHVPLVRAGRLAADEVTALFAAAGTRGIPERLADLRAQAACNALGARLLDACAEAHGDDVLAAWTGHLLDHGEEVMREVLGRLSDGAFEDRLDDGSRVRVTIAIRDGRARIDFSGTAGQHAGNRNAPRAITIAAVLYVFRCLAARPIPLNAGCLRPLEIVIPQGSLLDPAPGAAVAGGNVETSQRLVDVLLGALGLSAASQGTMNNVSFGDEGFGYYETVCGGAGAGPGHDGASAVHTHMTNTRITDVEVLERRYPVVVREFSIRRGSGGPGRWKGGDGVVRELEFLRPLACTVLAERRKTAPFGLHSGGPGAPGSEIITPTSLRLATPGGGGFG